MSDPNSITDPARRLASRGKTLLTQKEHEERHMLYAVGHISSDEKTIGLRDTTKFKPDPSRPARSPRNPNLSPQAMSPLPEPVLYRSFDWYASNERALLGHDFEGTNVQADQPVNTIKSPRKSIELQGATNEEGEPIKLIVGSRYFYKQFSEDRRVAGNLLEVTPKYLTFKRSERGYTRDECFRWADLQEVWNNTGQQSLWTNEKGFTTKAKESLDKRGGWKKEAGLYTASWLGKKSAESLDCGVQIKLDA
jgi:hypothetical protein